MTILVTTYPFGDPNPTPRRLLEKHSEDVWYNPKGRKLTEGEVKRLIAKTQPDIIIAGTEKYTVDVLNRAKHLNLISRVGIGVDNIDLDECNRRGILVANTPDAPSNAVAELTVCQMINTIRRVQDSNELVKSGSWRRYIGRDIRDCEIGVIGCGRVGRLVIEKLQGLKPHRIFANDIIPERCHNLPRTEPAIKQVIFAKCDIVTIHIPYNRENHHYVTSRELDMMKPESVLINTSRGEIVCEEDLLEWLQNNPDNAAAVDVFAEEPYRGELIQCENTYLTPHLGSCTRKARFDMEMGAVEAVLDYIEGRKLNNIVT